MPSDVFIAIDGGTYFGPFLFNYGGILYQLTTTVDYIPGPPVGNPSIIKMWKSTDGGVTWNVLASTLTLADFVTSSAAPCLLGTQLYLWLATPAFTTTLAYFDFTTDTFTTLTTTSSPSSTVSKLLAGPDASHLFAVYGDAGVGAKSIGIAEYVSNAYSVIGTLSPVSPYTNCQPQQMIYGTSGILHLLYEATQQSSAIGPSDLGYLNVISGSIGGSIGSNIIYANYTDSFLVPDTGIPLGRPLQIGSAIYVSFYDPFNQKLKLLTFGDVSSPSFTFYDIDPSWAITAGAANDEPGTGSFSNVLAYYGGALYCFYVNTWDTSSGFSGDGTLYYRSSTNGGVTWSARQAIITHLDPVAGTPFRIWYPIAMTVVTSSPPISVSRIGLSYLQAQANSQSPPQYLDGRFFYNFPLISNVGKNYVF